MTPSSNRVKKLAREHMQSHPGTKYTDARRAILDQERAGTTAPAGPPQVAQPNADEARAALLQQGLAQLDALVGMAEAKEQVAELRGVLRSRQELIRRGKHAPSASTNNLVLAGPPGTGKTDLAEILCLIYAGLGVTRTENFVMVGRSDLEAPYEGQTTMKTKAVIDSAVGGVLYIDDAYNLIQDRGGYADPFGEHVVTELLAGMEEHANDLVVILSGYEQDIQRFLSHSPSLESRFTTTIRLHSYRSDDLANIAAGIAAKRSQILSPATREAFKDYVAQHIDDVVDATSGMPLIDRLGNARFARNVVETAERMRAVRLMPEDLTTLSDHELLELTAADVTAALERKLGRWATDSMGDQRARAR